jgi:ketosteroid isomerase-like protein
MQPKSPADICRLFKQYMREGNIEKVLSVYDPECVFLNLEGESKRGRELRQELAPFAVARAEFDFDIKQIVEAGDIALMHTRWHVSGPQTMSVYAIEVARRQPDGSWRWLIGDPFTVGKQAAIALANSRAQRDPHS